MGVAHLDVIPEDVVGGDFEGRDAGAGRFALQHAVEVILPAVGQPPKLIQFGRKSRGDGTPFANADRGLLAQHGLDALAQGVTGVKGRGQFFQGRGLCLPYLVFDGDHRLEGILQLHGFARAHLPGGYLGDEPFQVAHAPQLLLDAQKVRVVPHKVGNHLVPAADGFQIDQGQRQPPPQHTPSHGGAGLVNHLKQGDPFRIAGAEELQVLDRKAVHPDEVFTGQPPQGADMPKLPVLGFPQIMQHRGCRDDAEGQAFDPKAFESAGLEMAREGFPGIVVLKDPVFEVKGVVFRSEAFGEFGSVFLGKQHFFGPEVLQPFVYAFGAGFGHEEFAGGDIQKGNPHAAALKMHSRQKIVRFGLQQFVAERYPGGDQLGDPPLYDGLGLFGVFQLVADGHPLPGLDQFGQVGVQGVVRKARQGCHIAPVVALGEHNVEDVGCLFSV